MLAFSEAASADVALADYILVPGWRPAADSLRWLRVAVHRRAGGTKHQLRFLRLHCLLK